MARAELEKFLVTLMAFPPRQRPASFTIDQLMEPFYRFEGTEQ
jgi:arylsulfatase